MLQQKGLPTASLLDIEARTPPRPVPRVGGGPVALAMGKPSRRGIALRIFATVWLVYGMHLATDVVRETYLALALGDHLSIRVDEYLGLHPDLFEMAGRGAYINNNPGASMLGALPYAAARPFMAVLFKAKPELVRPKPPTTYADPRPNRSKFTNLARARGLDIKLGLAAGFIQIGLMAPLGALAALAVFLFLRRRLGDERKATWLALLYAFGTPIFFRSAFLNQNAIVAHCVLFAYMLAVGSEPRPEGAPPAMPSLGRLAAIGALLGLGILCDYSAVPLAVAFGVWLMWRAGAAARAVARLGPTPVGGKGAARGPGAAVEAAARTGLVYVAGAALPIAVLLGYQYAAFGNPLFPAQHYMPTTDLSVRGWNGVALPIPELLWRNLLDPRYGLLVFAPMLLAAPAALWLKRREGGPTSSELWLAFGATAALYLFCSSIEFALLQWNTGVRYMVPAAPLLFFALVPVLLRLPRWALWSLVLPTLVISWSVAMARESVPMSLALIFLRGFQLPWLEVLHKTAGGYLPFLSGGASPLPIFCLVGVVL
ncbi:MAG TPA: hypothetical protein VF832_07100, partial [Longimicrobiales bacterium]